jgi:menaquinone-specific isochorismate synthase
MDFALLYDGQKCISGWGNHRSLSNPEGPCFWINDFQLNDLSPWKSFENFQESEAIPAQFLSYFKQVNDWSLFEKNQFKDLWESAQEEMQIASLEKIVLALSDTGRTFVSRKALPSFQNRRGFFYAFKIHQEFVWGYTPELFFKKNESSPIETVALAGTFKKGDFLKSAQLSEREKALGFEHSLVVEYFQSLAKRLNLSVKLSEREELEQGNIVHLQTKILLYETRSNDFQSNDLGKLISNLHPTPALGVFPKNKQSLDCLYSLRKKAGLPSFYGAPFGFSNLNESLFVVMIRGHFQSEEVLKRSIGVGITKYSDFEAEWAELQQKRKSMELLWNH